MATTTMTDMRSVVVSFNPKDTRAARMIEALRVFDFFKVEDSPYDPEYVANIKAMDKRTFKAVKTEDLWK